VRGSRGVEIVSWRGCGVKRAMRTLFATPHGPPTVRRLPVNASGVMYVVAGSGQPAAQPLRDLIMKRLLTASPLGRRLAATSMSRRHLAVRRLALLSPAVLVLSIPTVASASAGSRISKATGARPAAAALAAPRPTAVAARTRNFIWNIGKVGLGVIHVRDGHYKHGTYDTILPPGRFTDQYLGWGGTAGWYTGRGYCTIQDRSEGGPWLDHWTGLGAGQHFIGAHTSYMVNPYRCF
jgi:hypothetical protein